jgi:class 3 adenylate cyclase
MDRSSDTGANLTIGQLAEATGSSLDTLRTWRDLGLFSSRGAAFSPQDVERVRLLQFVQARGLGPEAVARACQTQGDLLGVFVDSFLAAGGFLPGDRLARHSLAEAAVASGLDPAVLQRLWTAAGLGDQDEAYDDDVKAFGWLRTALDAGLPEDALAQILRVFADALGRVAHAESQLFHHYVHERFRADGLAGTELLMATETVSKPLMGLIEPTVLYFHRKAFQRAQREDLLLHLTEDVTPPAEVPGEIDATILFVDLSGFTPLTEAMGDAAAARLMERFGHLVRDAARRFQGRVVKQIGDEFMLAFSDPASAVSCGLEIEAATSAEPHFPAVRMGAHSGAVLYREGDYIGATVNVAARVVAEAGRHQFVVTDAVRAAATVARGGAEVTSFGTRELKGIGGQLELFEVHRFGDRPLRTIDPVCLMELDPATAPAQLTWHATDLRFCSDDCLRLFVASPDRYGLHQP